VGLEDIAAGLEVTEQQRDRGVATVDETGGLSDRLEPVADRLPCGPAAAATLVERYAGGADVGTAARAAGVAPTTGVKTLYRLGEPVVPLSPTEREVVRDFLGAELPRTDAVALVGDEWTFALGVYVETHEVLEAGRVAVAGHLETGSTVDPLAETRSDVEELF
jgi:hypothetical protein